MDKFYVYRPMIDLLGRSEGTAPPKGRGYNETLAYGAYTGGPVDLVNMTLDQVDKLQTNMLAHPKNTMNSSAAGWGQIVRTTRRNIQKTLGIPGSKLFDKEMQDRMICYLLGVRGIDKWLAGRMRVDTLINNLAMEWASLPRVTGKGHYGGQNASVTVDQVRAVLAEVANRHHESQPIERVEVEVQKPVVPVTVEKEVRQKTNWLSSIFGGLFGAGGVGAFFAGMDWQSLALVAGIGVLVIAVVLVGGEWLVKRVRSIKRELEA